MHKNKLYILGEKKRRPAAVREDAKSYSAKAGEHRFISMFSGAMGMDLGLEAAGLAPAGCLELDSWACKTIRRNRPDVPLIEDDIRNWDGPRLLSEFALPKGSVSVVVGGPPCPSFSTAGRRQSFNDPRGQVMFDFLRIVADLAPPYFVMENVRGILSASLQHRPLNTRSNGKAHAPEEERGSVMQLLHAQFKRMGYVVTVQLVNSANYGVPQKRERVIFIGSRRGLQVPMPVGDYGPEPDQFTKPWKTLRDALRGLKDPQKKFMPFSESRLKYFRLLSEGQNWRDLPQALIKEAMGGAYESSGGKVGFYRRLAWDVPAPTVPTSPIQKSTAICHPEELRPLSVREYARVQQFPDEWIFEGPVAKQYMQIGNAVPVGLGFVVGKTLLHYLDNYEEETGS